MLHRQWRGDLQLQSNLLSEHVVPKNPSLQTQTKVSTLTSMQVHPLSHGELSQATHGAVDKTNKLFRSISRNHFK